MFLNKRHTLHITGIFCCYMFVIFPFNTERWTFLFMYHILYKSLFDRHLDNLQFSWSKYNAVVNMLCSLCDCFSRINF